MDHDQISEMTRMAGKRKVPLFFPVQRPTHAMSQFRWRFESFIFLHAIKVHVVLINKNSSFIVMLNVSMFLRTSWIFKSRSCI